MPTLPPVLADDYQLAEAQAFGREADQRMDALDFYQASQQRMAPTDSGPINLAGTDFERYVPAPSSPSPAVAIPPYGGGSGAAGVEPAPSPPAAYAPPAAVSPAWDLSQPAPVQSERSMLPRTSGPLVPNQFGDPTLTADEAYAACGPAAAVAFARAMGRNPTLREATDLAREVGWNTQGGMNGVGNQKRLLDRMGIASELDPSGDWGRITRAAASGTPVAISTTTHYFVADDYRDGKYHVGASGRAFRGGSEWMTRAEIERIGQGVNGALYMSGQVEGGAFAGPVSGRSALSGPVNGVGAAEGQFSEPYAQSAPRSPQDEAQAAFAAWERQQEAQRAFDAWEQTQSRTGGIVQDEPPLTAAQQYAATGDRDAFIRMQDEERAASGTQDPEPPAQNPLVALNDARKRYLPSFFEYVNRTPDEVFRDATPQEIEDARQSVLAFRRDQTEPTREEIAQALIRKGMAENIGFGTLDAPRMAGGAAAAFTRGATRVADQAPSAPRPGVVGSSMGQMPGSSGPGQWRPLDPARDVVPEGVQDGLRVNDGMRWAIFDDSGRLIEHGQDAFTRPAADQIAAWQAQAQKIARERSQAKAPDQMAEGPAIPSIRPSERPSAFQSSSPKGRGATSSSYAGRPSGGKGNSWYHGTNTEFDAPTLGREPAFDDEGRLAGDAFYLTNDTKVGEHYAGHTTEVYGGKSVVRAFDLDPDTRLYDLAGQVGRKQARFLATLERGARQLGDTAALEAIADARQWQHHERTPAFALFSSVANFMPQATADERATAVGRLLQAAGYDGVLHADPNGGTSLALYNTRKLLPQQAAPPDAGRAPAQANAAFSVDLGGAAAGGAVGAMGTPEDATWDERVRNVGMGALGGLALTHAATSGIGKGGGGGGSRGRQMATATANAGDALPPRGPSLLDRSGVARVVDDAPSAGAAPPPPDRGPGTWRTVSDEEAVPPAIAPVRPRGDGPQASSDPAVRKVAAMYDAPPRQDTGSSTMGTAARTLVRWTTDRGVDLAHFQQQAARAAGRPLRADELASELTRLDPTTAASVRIQEGLQPAIRSVGDDYDWLTNYLTHQDNLDVAAAMGAKAARDSGRNPAAAAARGAKVAAERRFSGGLTVADSERALAAMRADLGPERMRRLEEAAEQVWRFGHEQLARKRDAGVISAALHDELVTRYPHYVPTRILDFMDEGAAKLPPGKKLTAREAGIRANSLEGTVREREDPLASMVRLAHQSEKIIRKQQAAEAFMKLAKLHPDGSLIREAPEGWKRTRDFDKISVFQNGERVDYIVPAHLATAINMESAPLIPGLSIVMNLVRAAITTRNPTFLASNALMDAATYMLRSSMREGGPQALPRVAAELIRAYGDTFAGLTTGEFRGATARYLKQGGGMSGYFSGSPQLAQDAIRDLRHGRAIGVSRANVGAILADLVKLEPVQAIGERIELAPRVAQMRLAEKRGADRVRSTIQGRTVTMDFAQGGTVAKMVNQFIPFFNVGVQGGVTATRAFRENPKAFAATVGALLMGPTAAVEVWNRADEQRRKDYEDVPEYLKDTGAVIMLPLPPNLDKEGDRKPQYLHIPTREFSPFVLATREAIGRVFGAEGRGAADLLGGLAKSTSPVHDITDLAPVGLSTGLQLRDNRDWFRNRQIVTKRNEEEATATARDVLAPALQSVLRNAPMLSNPDAKVTGAATEFAIRDVAGGMGGAALAAGDALQGRIRKDERPQSLPVVGGLLGRFVRDQGGEVGRDARDAVLTRSAKDFLANAGIPVTVSPVDDKVKNINLRSSEQAQLQRLTNRYVDEAIQEFRAEGEWREMPPAEAQTILEKRIQSAKRRAEYELLDTIPDDEIDRRIEHGLSKKAA